ncbi:hypothetical protein KIN20_002887 [Parelaphostrongylus tenuis]|uniref:Lipoprotein n=1 Tax=Parelaphostrongylus tenuis TaxID=148309 RepID=A0AAD5QDA1_PARTN|nr:hypothetical protein KIN20_002887 [Parelaphostrongylus tenuis]
MKRVTNRIISLVATISTVLGCGVMPRGQGNEQRTAMKLFAIKRRSFAAVSTRNFTVTSFTLPVAMVYSDAVDVRAQVPDIAANAARATGFAQRLIVQTVFDVLASQACNALLPDAVISGILSQLEVNVRYAP